ncbi:MAG: hypothetical protein M1830_009909 [Pleopsidium flavum]|nr:MAG: hypothetical protein M1830_009909 [Pleopsidium flavum]
MLVFELWKSQLWYVQDSIKTRGGGCVVRMLPRAVNEGDDTEIQALMDQKEKEDQEVSGDEDKGESESDSAEEL